jgi:hypothetical protein
MGAVRAADGAEARFEAALKAAAQGVAHHVLEALALCALLGGLAREVRFRPRGRRKIGRRAVVFGRGHRGWS